MPATGTARLVLLIGLAAIFLAGCAAPYATTPAKEAWRELQPQLSAQGAKVIAICYNRALNTPERVLQEARFACGGGEVTFHDDDVIWNSCGLVQPVRSNFMCTPRPLPE